LYQVHKVGDTLMDIAKRILSAARVEEVFKLNPDIKPDAPLAVGTIVKLPGDACIPSEDAEAVKPLPLIHPSKGVPATPKIVLPLTGAYPCNLDDKRTLLLPKAIREQLGDVDTVLVSPGPDLCLWLTNQAHLERMAERLEKSPAREIDVRVFKRLYFAQTEKATLTGDGKVVVSDRLAQFAGLGTEVILIGIDDHFEVWDAARWKKYTQAKSARSSGDHE
jgi:MraZ protein